MRHKLFREKDQEVESASMRGWIAAGVLALAGYCGAHAYLSQDTDVQPVQPAAQVEIADEQTPAQYHAYDAAQDAPRPDAPEQRTRSDTGLESRLQQQTQSDEIRAGPDESMLDNYSLALVDETVDFPMSLDRSLYSLVDQFRAVEDDFQRARAIFDWEQANVTYGAARRNGIRYRNAIQTWRDREGVCGEEAYLYVALARASNLTAKFAIVNVDAMGRSVEHACAVVYVRNRQIIVDPAYYSFDIAHQQFAVIDDARANQKFAEWREGRGTCSP